MCSAGDHVPVIPLFDVVGNAASVVHEQIGATALNVSVMFGFTVIVNVVGTAYCPSVDVNV